MADAAGFGPEMLRFLEDLRFHNEREWFEANKLRYEQQVRGPALAFMRDVKRALDPKNIMNPGKNAAL